MSTIKFIAECVGWIVIAMWLAGALNLADFVLRFGPHTTTAAKPTGR